MPRFTAVVVTPAHGARQHVINATDQEAAEDRARRAHPTATMVHVKEGWSNPAIAKLANDIVAEAAKKGRA